MFVLGWPALTLDIGTAGKVAAELGWLAFLFVLMPPAVPASARWLFRRRHPGQQ